MNALDAITLKAFLVALTKLDSPLPGNVQAQLNEIGSITPSNVGKLDALAESYPPLNEHYQDAREILQISTSERSKAGFPKINHATEIQNTEIENIVAAIDEETDSQKLTDITTQVCNNSDSVSAAKLALTKVLDLVGGLLHG